MNKIKIRLSTPEMVSDFINVCSKYDCDINLHDGRNVIDAKSIVSVFAITQGKVIEVEAITADKNVILRFIDDMRKYEVQM